MGKPLKNPWLSSADVGIVIRELREKMGISQGELSKNRCGLAITYVNQIESGKKNPSLESMDKIANALGIKLSRLIRLAEKNKEDE